ncbi:MAG: hypothetical protein KAH22_00030 [Thiotrichaceae bacterium]|nr:hypothetical protein [Thiotrichaceae bacterium]
MSRQTPLKKALCASVLAFSFIAISPIALAGTFTVTGVSPSDVLNLRITAGSGTEVVAHIPPGGSAILLTGQEEKIGSTTWVEINWQGITGWVNKRFLAAEAKKRAPVQRAAPVTVRATKANTGDANRHLHPKNKCTNSITHSHPNGSVSHKHRYSCSGNGGNAGKTNSANTHRHPPHSCTRSVTHNHPNGSVSHKHKYSCNPNKIRNAPTRQQMGPKKAKHRSSDANAHTHGANDMTESRTHSHPNGAHAHKHQYMNTKL